MSQILQRLTQGVSAPRTAGPPSTPADPTPVQNARAWSFALQTPPRRQHVNRDLITGRLTATPAARIGQWHTTLGSIFGPSSVPRSVNFAPNRRGEAALVIKRFADVNAASEVLSPTKFRFQSEASGSAPGTKIAEQEADELRERLVNQASFQRFTLGWSEESVFIYQKLALRGREPLVPFAWRNVFPNFPNDLFAVNRDDCFLNSVSGREMRGELGRHKLSSAKLTTKASESLSRLTFVSRGVREAIRTVKRARRRKLPLPTQRTPELTIARGVAQYIRWAAMDCGFHADTYKLSISVHALRQYKGPLRIDGLAVPLPILLVGHARREEDAKLIQHIMLRRFRLLQSKWASALRSSADDDAAIPPLYGIVSSGSLMLLVCYEQGGNVGSWIGGRGSTKKKPVITARTNSSKTADFDSAEARALGVPECTMRTIGFFEMASAAMEVWNALAAAILIVHCRNRMVDLNSVVDELHGGTYGDRLTIDPDV